MLPGDQMATEGMVRFEAGDPAGPMELLHSAIDQGVSGAGSVEIYLALTSSSGMAARGIDATERFLADNRLDIAPLDQVRLRTEVLLSMSGTEPDFNSEERRLLAMLQAAAAAGSTGWLNLGHPEVRRLIHEHLLPTRFGLEAAEQLLYAPPETEWPGFALQQIETIGLAAAHDSDLARAAERLLHEFGNPQAAYRVEQERRSWSKRVKSPTRAPARTTPTPLTGSTVAIAGGHPALRVTIGDEITSLGGQTREIPSRFEAVRRDKDVLDVLRGADVAVVIIPQIAHSTSDQVKRAAGKLSLPVISALSASAGSIVALITQWCDESNRR